MITVKLKGGMGNQMFQYALGRSLSIKNNTELKLDLAYLLDRTPRSNFTFRDFDIDIFNIKASIVPQSELSFLNKTFRGKAGLYFYFFKRKFLKLRGVEKSFSFDSSVLNYNNVYLDGYWQSYKYFEGIEDIIRSDFTLKNELPINIKNLMEVIKLENSLCVHVRRGDYVGSSYYNSVGKDYYDNGIKHIRQLSKIDKIYVFSDDIRWCEENMKFDLPTMFVGDEYSGDKASGHLMLMRSCKNFIIPNSTFSWWAAWLSENKNKIVIAPSQWFGDRSISNDDLIPEKWTRM